MSNNNNPEFVIGMDLGDKKHILCVLDESGDVVGRDSVANNEVAIVEYFQRFALPERVTVAMETGRSDRQETRGHTGSIASAKVLI